MLDDTDILDSAVHNVVLDAFDPDAMTETVQHSTIEHTLLHPGHFKGQLLQARLGNCRLDWGNYTLPVLARGPLASDRLTHLGRVAIRYKSMFGESPSVTLKTRAPKPAV